jgi:hypothetical protein
MMLQKKITTNCSASKDMTGHHDFFSLNPDMLRRVLNIARPLGHHEHKEKLNWGFGFLYYAMVRILRPNHIVVIGSGYGFSVICLALGCRDNGRGRVSFVDPGFSLLKDGPFRTLGGTGKWKNAEQVKKHFQQFGVDEQVTHYLMTSREFFLSYKGFDLPHVDLGFIDGNHAFNNVREDFLGLAARYRSGGYLFLHDSHIYFRETFRHAGVKKWIRILKKNPKLFEVLDFPFSSGVALIRILNVKRRSLHQWIEEMKRGETKTDSDPN